MFMHLMIVNIAHKASQHSHFHSYREGERNREEEKIKQTYLCIENTKANSDLVKLIEHLASDRSVNLAIVCLCDREYIAIFSCHTE